MFEEFSPKAGTRDRRRFGASLAISSALYLGIGGGIVAATAATKAVVEDELTQVEFAPPIEAEAPPPPPPPVVKAASTPRKKAARADLAPPDEIPDEKLKESDAPLVAEGPTGPVDGFTDGVEGGTGSAPAAVVVAPPPPPPAKPQGPIHLPEKATAPELLPGNPPPAYPEEARKAGVTGVVIAKIVVREDGTVGSVEIMRGPEVFHASVKAALARWRYKPARLPDGTVISTFKIVQVPFRLENM